VDVTPPLFTPGKEHRYPWYTRLGGANSRSGRFGKETNLIILVVIQTPDRPTCSLVTIPALYRYP